MKLGLSSYSLNRCIREGRMTLEEAIDWAAQNGAECMEFVPFAFRFDDDEGNINYDYIKKITKHAKDAGIALCNYSVLADLLKDGEEQEAEIKRVCHHVDIAAELGVPRMRHDISAFRRPLGQNTLKDFDDLLPKMIDAAKRITSYAKTKGVKTLIENHGFFVNGCDRVERVLNGVNDENYGLLLDTGNIICMDEDPVVAARLLAERCEMVHLKDFYIRHKDPGDTTQFDCGGHWFRSKGGKYLRGSIFGQGDIDVHEVLKALKDADYKGNIAIEFEGMEDPVYASFVSLGNARRIWDEV